MARNKFDRAWLIAQMERIVEAPDSSRSIVARHVLPAKLRTYVADVKAAHANRAALESSDG